MTYQRRSSRALAKLKFFGYLADIVGCRAKEMTLDKPVALREMLPSPFPEENIIILVNQKVGNLDSLIKDEDSVVLMPFLSGG
jgi:molybdopterin converting factor small subunit